MQVIENIHTYLPQIGHLFIIDNSEIVNTKLAQYVGKFANVTYIPNRDNMGVAYALNQAASMAIKAGYQFLLTMDDDTSLPEDAIQTMLTYANQHDIATIGIIAGQSVPRLFGNNVKTVSYTITSGNILNLSAYKNCGPFMNELFIDFVDHEYCFRLINNNYKIIEINNIHLKHKLGEKKYLRILEYKFPFYWISHNPLRIYYKTRNCLFVLKNYNYVKLSVRLIFFKEIFKDFFKILLLEEDKKNRFTFFFKAITDGFKGNLGKFIVI